MTPMGIAITSILFILQLRTNKDVIRIAKQLVKNVDNKDIKGEEKTKLVLAELEQFFRGIVPIILEAIIKMAVLDMQNKNGVLQTKIEEMQK